METDRIEPNGSEQNSDSTVPTACPDKEESGEGKLWPEFWPVVKKRAHLWTQLSQPQLQYMTDFYLNKREHGKPKMKLNDWNLYFGVANAKKAILGPKSLPEELKLKIPKTPMPSEVEVQPADIAGDSGGLRPENSAHIHDTDIPFVSPTQILTDDVKRKIEIGTESAVHQRVPVPKNFCDLYRMLDSTFVKKEERQQKGIPTLDEFCSEKVQRMLEENELIVVNTEPIVRKCIQELRDGIPQLAFEKLCDKDGASPAKARECMHEYLNSLDDKAWEKIFAKIMEEKFTSSTRFQVQLSSLPNVPSLGSRSTATAKNIYQKKCAGREFLLKYAGSLYTEYRRTQTHEMAMHMVMSMGSILKSVCTAGCPSEEQDSHTDFRLRRKSPPGHISVTNISKQNGAFGFWRNSAGTCALCATVCRKPP